MTSVSGWFLVLGFFAIQLLMYGIFKRWRKWVWTSLEVEVERQLGLSLEDVKKGDRAALLQFPEDRKKMIWLGLGIAATFFFFIDLAIALDESNFDRPDALAVLLLFFLFGDIGSAVVWLGFLDPYGNIRIVASDGILKRSPYFLGTEFVEWNRIESVRWWPFARGGAFAVHTDRGWFLIARFLTNIDWFSLGIMKHVPKERWIRVQSRM